jgi:hypothetical protein
MTYFDPAQRQKASSEAAEPWATANGNAEACG